MKPYTAESSALIHAEPEVVYSVIADYKNGHPHILPKPYFVSLSVIKGGYGAGTRIKFQMKLFGTNRDFEAVITEPEPGRVLVETNVVGGGVSTFRVEPSNGGRFSSVTISTSGTTERGGILGSIELMMSRSFLQRIYKKELALLDAVAQQRAPSDPVSDLHDRPR